MSEKLKEELKAHFAEVSLSTEELSRLRQGKRSRLFLPLASAVCLIFFGVFMLKGTGNWRDIRGKGDLPHDIAMEIAKNHEKALPMEFTSEKLEEIKAVFTKLPFDVLAVNDFLRNGWKVQGARYCSVQGEIALQLKLLKPTPHTLYVTAVPDEFTSGEYARKEHDEFYGRSNDTNVIVWHNDGLLYGLAYTGPELGHVFRN